MKSLSWKINRYQTKNLTSLLVQSANNVHAPKSNFPNSNRYATLFNLSMTNLNKNVILQALLEYSQQIVPNVGGIRGIMKS